MEIKPVTGGPFLPCWSPILGLSIISAPIVKKTTLVIAIACLFTLSSANCRAAEPVIVVHANQPGTAINPGMWGVFFEDINFGADGGLYAELIKNRSFEFPDPLMGWVKIHPSLARGDVIVHDDHPFNPANPHYVRIESEAQVPLGIAN